MIGWERLPRGGSKRKYWQGFGGGRVFWIKPLRRACKTIGWNLSSEGLPPVRFGTVEAAKRHAETLMPADFRRAVWPAHPWDQKTELSSKENDRTGCVSSPSAKTTVSSGAMSD
jgi:hypothetical protein